MVAFTATLFAALMNMPFLIPFIIAGSYLKFKGMGHVQGLSFAGLCSDLSGGVTLSCATPLVGGVEADIIILVRKHIDTTTFNSGNNYILEDIALLTGKQAYKFEGKNNSARPKNSLVVKDFSKGKVHTLDFLIFDDGPTTKLRLDELQDASVCVFVKNKFKGATGNATWSIHGFHAGLSMTACEQDKFDENTNGAWKVTLASDPKSLEAQWPLNVFITSATATEALITTLLSPAA